MKDCDHCGRPNLHTGSVITYTTESGLYWTPGHPNENGSATVMLQYTVTGVFQRGYSLSLTSGTIVLGTTTYALTSGSAEFPHLIEHLLSQVGSHIVFTRGASAIAVKPVPVATSSTTTRIN